MASTSPDIEMGDVMKNPLVQFIDQLFEDINTENERRKEEKKTRALLKCVANAMLRSNGASVLMVSERPQQRPWIAPLEAPWDNRSV